MDNQELIQQVYNLVQKAIKKIEESDDCLDVAAVPGQSPLILTSAHGTTCHPALERLGGICALLCNDEVDLDKVSCVVIYDLTLDNLSRLALGCADNGFAGIAARALLMGKPVYAVREGVELLGYEQSGGAYYDLLNEHLTKLQRCGLAVVAEADLDEAVLGLKKPEKASRGGGAGKSVAIGKKVLTESDVRQALANGACELLIEPKAIVTSLAAEYAVKKSITITRMA